MSEPFIDILLVEDSADDAALVRAALREVDTSIRLQIARDGAEALQLLFGSLAIEGRPLRVRPKVLWLDLKMPRINGLELLRRLKAHPPSASVPVVILSSSQERRDLVDCYAARANSFVVKPTDFDQFAELVRHLAGFWLKHNRPPPP